MNYFKQKADKIEEKIHLDRVKNNFKSTGEQKSRIIEIGLKEVVRDIRHQLIQKILDSSNNDKSGSIRMSDLEMLIMNFEPKARK